MTNAVSGLQPGEHLQRISERQNLIVNAAGDIVGIQNVTGLGADLRIGAAVDTAAVQAIVQANTQLGALASPVQSLIDTAIAANNPAVNQLSNKTGILDPLKVGPFVDAGTTYPTLSAYLAFLSLKAGTGGGGSPTAPVKNAAPYVTFPASHTVTITNASPGVVTWTAHGKSAGDWVEFTTTGGLPTGLSVGVVYYVLAAGLATDTFRVSLTAGGAAINTSSAGSGTHTGWSSADVADAPIYHAGTYSSGTVTSRDAQLIVNGSVIATVTGVVDGATLPVISAAAGLGLRQYGWIELANWASTPPVSNASAIYTVNAPAAVPVNITAASLTGTAAVGQLLTGSVGSWSNTPTGYVKTFYRNGVSIATTTSAATTLTYTTLAADAGASITFGTVATNAAGSSIESISSPLVIAGGVAPSWTAVGAVQPGWVNGTFQVGVLMTADVGAAANNPAVNGYSYQVLRDGAAILGASGSNVSGFTYMPVSADQDHELSFSLTASNAAGSATTTAASVTINAATGGGGGTASFVGTTQMGTNTAASGTLAPPGSIQNLDFGLLIQTNNGPVNWNAPTGTWTQDGATQSLTTNGERAETWTRVLSGSEPGTYTISPVTPEVFGAVICAWRGPTSVVARNVNTNDTANASPVVPSWLTVTPTAVNQTVVLVGILDNSAGSTSSWTPPAGYTLRAQEDFTGAGGQWASIVVFDKIVSTTAATGTLTASAALAAGTAGWITFTLVLG